MTAPRVVSLLPSATEIVAALGLGPALVGRSHECDFPRGVERLPVCTEARLDASAPSPLAETLEALAEMLHPELFGDALEGPAWRRLGSSAGGGPNLRAGTTCARAYPQSGRS